MASERVVHIVDDSSAVLRALERLLNTANYAVHCYERPRDFLEAAKHSIDGCVILDLRMPLVDGLQFLRTLRSKDELSKMPVAIVTGDYFLDDAVSRELRGLGAEVRFKPLWLEDLLALARNLLKA